MKTKKMKFVIGKPEPESKSVVRLFLQKGDKGEVDLMAQKKGESSFYILTFHPSGRIKRPECIPENIGFHLDGKGRLLIEELKEAQEFVEHLRQDVIRLLDENNQLKAKLVVEPTFYEIIEEFIQGERNAEDYNFCIQEEINGTFTAYIMGAGAEQCLARKNFINKSVVEDLFHSLGVKHIRPGVG
jgi:hypothetical protein